MSTDLSKNAAFDNVDDLLGATMDDVSELPPLAIPPTGSYTLKVSIARKEVGGKDALVTSYEVVEVHEVANEDEKGEVVVGQQFQNGTYTKKKDGKANEMGIAAFKGSLVPFAAHFFPGSEGTTTLGEIINKVDGILVLAQLKRTPKKDGADDEFNFRMKSVTVL